LLLIAPASATAQSAEAAALQLEIEPLTGSEIHALLAKAYASSGRILHRAADLLGRGGGSQ
jgi:hypothetical protein